MPAPTNLGGQKTSKIWHNFWRLRLWSQISLEMIDVTKIGKTHDQLQPLRRWAKKVDLWSTNKKVIGAHVDPPKWTFSGNYMSTVTGCCRLRFFTQATTQIVFSVWLGEPYSLKLGCAHISSLLWNLHYRFYLAVLGRAQYCYGKLSVRLSLSICNVEVSW